MEVTDGTSGGGEARKEGWLVKQGHLVKNWKRRYFVLEAYKSIPDKQFHQAYLHFSMGDSHRTKHEIKYRHHRHQDSKAMICS